VDPGFIYRFEKAPAGLRAGAVYRISDLELASRLSFFLWSSLPDEELVGLAAKGRLSDASVLTQQTRRMLADPRAAALVDNLAGQWLQLRLLDVAPAPGSTATSRAFAETSSVRDDHREDRSVLIDRRRLHLRGREAARHHGIPTFAAAASAGSSSQTARRGLIVRQLPTVTSVSNCTSP
jgi:hypothetical protein